MKKNTKKIQQNFYNRTIDIFEEIGAKKQDLESYRYKLNTPLGELNLSVHEDNEYDFAIFTKFKDVEKAKEVFDCNPYSGKYNFHFGDMNQTINSFLGFIDDLYCVQ